MPRRRRNCDMVTPPAKPSPRPMNQHVTTFMMEMCSTSDVNDWRSDILK